MNQVIGREAATTGKLRIGHPMGVTAVSVEAEPSNQVGGVSFRMLGFSRTARHIMDGTVYVPRERLNPARLAA